MSDSNGSPQMGNAVNAQQATEIATKNVDGNKSTNQEAQPDFSKMTGAEAKAWVEAQKAKEAKAAEDKKLNRGKDGKFQAKDPYLDQKEQAKESNPVKEAAKAAEEAIKKYKVKVDGQELEVDEQELLRGYSHQKAANKKLQEGLAARKQAEEFIKMMKDQSSLFDVIQKLGHDPRKLAEQYLAQQLQEEMLDPKEKEFRDAQRKLKAYEDMERKQKEAAEAQVKEQMKAKFAQDYQTKFIKALEETGLPPTKHMVAEMAKYISRATKLNYEMSPGEAAKLVLEDIQNAQRRLIGDSDGETLIKLLGEDVANKVRKWDTDRLKDPNKILQTPQEQPQPREKRDPNKRMSAREWQMHKRGLK